MSTAKHKESGLVFSADAESFSKLENYIRIYDKYFHPDGLAAFTLRQDDIPFAGVKSIAIEKETTNLLDINGETEDWSLCPFYSDTNYWTNVGQYDEKTWGKVFYGKPATTSTKIYWHNISDLSLGKWYSFSFYAKANKQATATFRLSANNGADSNPTTSEDVTITLSPKWQRIELPFAPDNPELFYNSIDIDITLSTTDITLYFVRPSLEERVLPSSWTPTARPQGLIHYPMNYDYTSSGTLFFWGKQLGAERKKQLLGLGKKNEENKLELITDEEMSATTFSGVVGSVVNSVDFTKPEFSLYGTTIVNLLGKYGGFYTDSNSDGVADGMKPVNLTCSFAVGKQTIYADTVDSSHYIEARTIFGGLPPSVANHKYVFIAHVKPIVGMYRLYIYVRKEDGTYNVTSTSPFADERTVAVSVTATTVHSNHDMIARVAILNDTGNERYIGSGEGLETSYWRFVDLTEMGDLDPARQAYYTQKYGYTVTKWEELEEEDLAAELPYVDGAAAIGWDWTSGEKAITIENRGKNLLPNIAYSTYTHYWDNGWFVSNPGSIIANHDIILGSSSFYTYPSDVIPYNNQDVTVSVEFEGNGGAYKVFLACFASKDLGPIKYLYKDIISGSPVVFYSSEFPEGTQYIKPFIRNENSSYFKARNWILQIGASIDNYEPMRSDKITISGAPLIGKGRQPNRLIGNHVEARWWVESLVTDANGEATPTYAAEFIDTILSNDDGVPVSGYTFDNSTNKISGLTADTSYTVIYKLQTPFVIENCAQGDLFLYKDTNNFVILENGEPAGVAPGIAVKTPSNTFSSSANILSLAKGGV